MSGETGYRNRGIVTGTKISYLLNALGPATYDDISPKVGYWIEYALTEQSVNADDLVDQLSSMTWIGRSSNADVARFLNEFRDTPYRSEQARSFVDGLCSRILQLFAAASAEDLLPWNGCNADKIARWGRNGLVNAASLVGHLIECGVLNHELVRRHLIKPLIAHHYPDGHNVEYKSSRATAIYQLFVAAGNTLLQGLLEPDDVQICFETLDSEIPPGRVVGLNAEKLQEFRQAHSTWLERREEEEQRDAAAGREPGGEGDEDVTAAEVPAESETPVAFAPQDLPLTIDIPIPPSFLHGIEYPSVFRDVESPSDTSTNDRITIASSSPTLSISTVSDLTPTELDDVIGEGSGENIITHHETFYLEDGNVEVVCGHKIFRIHSPIVSFSSSKLRDILSPSALLNAPMTEGCPRIVFKDSAEDFAVLLRMIYTPGFVTRHMVPEFTTYASLLRMAAKYGFSDVREALVEDLKGAYPIKWEDFEAARVLGEDVFGSPKPHPNAVLNLFLEQNIKFALPFAAYRACLGGFQALVSDRPGTLLPRLTIATIIHGMGVTRRMMTHATYGIVHLRDLGVCPNRLCVLNVDMSPAEGRREALKKVSNVMFGGSEGVMLSPPSFGTLVCVVCAVRLEKAHVDCRKEFVWAALPSLLGWGGWEGV